MKLLLSFYDMHLPYKLYSTTGHYQKTYTKKLCQPLKTKESYPIVNLEKNSFENLAKYAYRWGISFFYECISVKALNHEFILNIALSRKRKHSNYKLLDNYFPIDGKSNLREGHHSNFPKDDFRVKYFEALDLVMAPIRTRFDQPSFIAFFLI